MLACDLIVEVRAARSVSEEQAVRLERSLPNGPVSHETIDFLFTVDRYADRAAPAWTQLLARAVLSGVVLGEAPSGALTEAKADWLIEKIGNDRIAHRRNLELIARVMARAESSPAWLRELLIDLSTRAGPSHGGARELHQTLEDAFSPADAPPPRKAEESSAEIVPLPEPIAAEIPVAAAA